MVASSRRSAWECSMAVRVSRRTTSCGEAPAACSRAKRSRSRSSPKKVPVRHAALGDAIGVEQYAVSRLKVDPGDVPDDRAKGTDPRGAPGLTLDSGTIAPSRMTMGSGCPQLIQSNVPSALSSRPRIAVANAG